MAAVDSYYLPGAEPFLLPGGPVGCLLLHGLMSSPGEVRWLGDYLNGQGFTVYGARLAGHGADYRDAARVRWRDWLGNALDGVRLLRATCSRVFLVGHSIGGVVCLLAATSVQVDGVAVLASPLRYNSRAIRFSPWLRHVIRYIDAPDRSGLPARVRAEQARRGEPQRGRVRYDRWSARTVAEAYQLSQTALARLPQVTAPLLTIYTTADDITPYENSALIAARAGSAALEAHTLHTSGHNLTLDCEHDVVFELVSAFVQRHSAG
ncbi:MAG: alpha/beta hydrolase [Chloroflexota bacterium]|nr:MAG: alpha/beta hydrolase [Chloroflexota bacterium]